MRTRFSDICTAKRSFHMISFMVSMMHPSFTTIRARHHRWCYINVGRAYWFYHQKKVGNFKKGVLGMRGGRWGIYLQHSKKLSIRGGVGWWKQAKK
jgi:hypothetical protein